MPRVITVSDLSPSIGSTSGSARIVVTGSGFTVGVHAPTSESAVLFSTVEE